METTVNEKSQNEQETIIRLVESYLNARKEMLEDILPRLAKEAKLDAHWYDIDYLPNQYERFCYYFRDYLLSLLRARCPDHPFTDKIIEEENDYHDKYGSFKGNSQPSNPNGSTGSSKVFSWYTSSLGEVYGASYSLTHEEVFAEDFFEDCLYSLPTCLNTRG